MWAHKQQPTRLCRPWDSPGKNTGMGCHFLLQCMKVKSESEAAQSCPTLHNPMDCSLPSSYPKVSHLMPYPMYVSPLPSLGPSDSYTAHWKLINWHMDFICQSYTLANISSALEEKNSMCWQKLTSEHLKQRATTLNYGKLLTQRQVLLKKAMIFPVVTWELWELDHKKGWALKNRCFKL